jgi:hypothetical protein
LNKRQVGVWTGGRGGKGAHRVLGGADVRDDVRLGIPTERVLQEESQPGVTVVNVPMGEWVSRWVGRWVGE